MKTLSNRNLEVRALPLWETKNPISPADFASPWGGGDYRPPLGPAGKSSSWNPGCCREIVFAARLAVDGTAIVRNTFRVPAKLRRYRGVLLECRPFLHCMWFSMRVVLLQSVEIVGYIVIVCKIIAMAKC